MKVAGSPQAKASAVWNVTTWSATIASGGSSVSWSVTFAATTVSVHVSLDAKLVSGSTVKEVGPPEKVALCVPLVAQEIVNHGPRP